MKKFFKKLFVEIPWWAWLISLALFGIQSGVYHFSDVLANKIGTIDYAFEPVIHAIDDKIPFVPFFIFFYFLSYPSWMLGFAIIGKCRREKYINFTIAVMTALIIGFLFFTFVPTKLDRVSMNVLEKAENGKGLLWWLAREVYKADGWERGYNALPSFHCMMSTFCLLPLIKDNTFKKGFKIYSVIIASLVYVSTLLTRQHYILDIPCGMALAAICYYTIFAINPGKKILAKHPKLDDKKPEIIEESK